MLIKPFLFNTMHTSKVSLSLVFDNLIKISLFQFNEKPQMEFFTFFLFQIQNIGQTKEQLDEMENSIELKALRQWFPTWALSPPLKW